LCVGTKDDTGKKHYPYGKGMVETDKESFISTQQTSGAPTVVKFPISLHVNDANESGEPLTLTRTNAVKELEAYHQLARSVASQLLRLEYGHSSDLEKEFVTFGDDDSDCFDVSSVSLSLNKSNSGRSDDTVFVVRLFSSTNAVQKEINPKELRGRDPRTGNPIPDSPFAEDSKEIDCDISSKRQRKSPSIMPTTVTRRGRYGFAVVWQDGATIIYSNRCLVMSAQGKVITPRLEEFVSD
jgi:hypothetical protein